MNYTAWIRVKCAAPSEGEIVYTKIDDKLGCRNVQKLMYHRGMWWTPDASMYVYYTPTHWRYI